MDSDYDPGSLRFPELKPLLKKRNISGVEILLGDDRFGPLKMNYIKKMIILKKPRY